MSHSFDRIEPGKRLTALARAGDTRVRVSPPSSVVMVMPVYSDKKEA